MARTTTIQKSLRIAVPSAWGSDQKGAFLEDIAQQALRKQSYEIIDRIRFTGMEIDLLGTHKPSDDKVYIECKFYEKNISANVLDLMVGQSFRRKIPRLALFSASPLSKEAKGALEELKADDRLSFSFYGPEQMLESMVDANLAPNIPADIPADVSHATLFIHPNYDYLWLFQEQLEGRPSRIVVYGNSSSSDMSTDEVRSLLDEYDVLVGLPVAFYAGYNKAARQPIADKCNIPPSEVVSRVGTADNLIDYRPCKPSDFVGRTGLQKEIWDFLGRVRERRTDTRLLALVGASGCGKSSLVAKLSERFRNKKWRAKYFLFPIDVRSARGPLFVAEALLTAINAASEAGFIESPDDLRVEDVDNVLSGHSVKLILSQLKSERKVLVIFFDQFEEAFTKDELFPVFKAFRRVALDVNARKENIVLGFSWRTGISLSDDNPAYQLWNELRDHRLTKTLEQFDSAESSRVISQFEGLLEKKLLPPLRRQLHEQGQGLPWFLKKLCIHVYNQVARGVSQIDLVGSRLNVKNLFDEDLEPLNEQQTSCLRYIAAKSPVDSLEIYERYGTDIVNELSDRRLIIRAGQRFAVYWDIFKEYLTEGKVPHIPWTYIPNCTLRMALVACDVLEENGPMSTKELAKALDYSERTTLNIISDLQNLVICGKAPDGKHNILSTQHAAEVIPDRMHSQFSDHILYQRLIEVSGEKSWLSPEEGVGVVRALYSSANVKPKTRDAYFSRLLPWLEFAGLVETTAGGIRIIPSNKRGSGFGREPSRRRGRVARGEAVFLGGSTPEATLEVLRRIMSNVQVKRAEIGVQGWRNAAADLVALGLAWWEKDQMKMVQELRSSNNDPETILADVLTATRTIQLFEKYLDEDKCKGRTEVGLRIADALGRAWKRSSALRYANGLAGYSEFLTKQKAQHRH